MSLACLVVSLLLLLVCVMGEVGWEATLALLLLHALLSGVHLTGLIGLAARLPTIYPGAVLLGAGMAGVLAALLTCLQVESGLSPRLTLIYGLILLLAVHLTAFDIHFALPLNDYYQQQTDARTATTTKVVGLSWRHLHLLLSCLLTHLLLPAVLHAMAPLAPSWSSPHFSTLLGFTNFHLSFTTGILSAVFSVLPPWWLLALLTVVRVILLPLLTFANLLPDLRLLPVLLTWDWTLLLTITLSGLLGGFLTASTFASCIRFPLIYASFLFVVVASLSSGHAPPPSEQGSRQARSLAGMRSYLVVVVGSLAGALLSLALPALLQINLAPR